MGREEPAGAGAGGEPAGAGTDGTTRLDRLERVVASLERAVASLAGAVGAVTDQVRTRRLVVEDGGEARVVAEVREGTAELRVELAGQEPGRSSAVVLFATPSRPGPGVSRPGPGPAAGLQLWGRGDAVAELDAWPDDGERWRPHLHLDGGA